MPVIKEIAAVALGAAGGGVLRFLASSFFFQRFGASFPWGTLFINVTGSFLIGIVAGFAISRTSGDAPLFRLFLTTGLIGGYTTFSAFSLDAIALIENGAPLLSALYVGSSVVVAIAGTAAGQMLARVAAR